MTTETGPSRRNKDTPLRVREFNSWETLNKQFLTGKFDEEGMKLLRDAHNDVFAAHTDELRLWSKSETDGKKRFFVEHPIETARTLMRLGIYDPNVIAAALLHDAPEDSLIFGNPTGRAYSEWLSDVRTIIVLKYNAKIADMVVALTKPPTVDGIEVKTAKEADEKQIENLVNGPVESILIKMADRLHNFKTVYGMPDKKLHKKIIETEEVLFMIFEKARKKYPTQINSLMNSMKKEIAKHKVDLMRKGYTF